jgi:hypothetical protein
MRARMRRGSWRSCARRWREMARHVWPIVGFAILTALLVGCGVVASPSPDYEQPPTVSPFFAGGRPVASPVVITRAPTATRRPTSTPDASPAGAGAVQAAPGFQIIELVIYDETVAADWTAENSWGVALDLSDRSYAYSGSVAAAITPWDDYGAFFLTLQEGAESSFLITDVLGVSLWINSGEDILVPNDLAVAVVGSNNYPHWVSDDDSVPLDDRRFSESRLSYLGINQTLTAERWFEVIVELDKLLYEPDYRYVTGVYVKNDEGVRQTFYVDRVVLLLVEPAAP